MTTKDTKDTNDAKVIKDTVDTNVNPNRYITSRNREFLLAITFLILSVIGYFTMNNFRGTGHSSAVIISTYVFFFCVLIFIVMFISLIKHTILVLLHVIPAKQDSWTKTFADPKKTGNAKAGKKPGLLHKVRQQVKVINEDEPVKRDWVKDLYHTDSSSETNKTGHM